MVIKLLDRLVLILSILAALVQLLFALSVSLTPQLQPISLFVFAICLIYTMVRFIYPSEQAASPEQQALQGSTPTTLTSTSAKQAYNYSASRYGIGYDLIQVNWTIENDGSATLQRIIEIEAFSKIESLDIYLLIPESDKDRKINFVSVDSLSPDWTVTLSEVKRELGRASAMISISPPLKKEEKMRFRVVENLPKGLYAINLTADELSQRQSKHDYCGWNINRPTRKASLQVEFPKFTKPGVFSAEVRYASTSGFPSSRLHYEEMQRFSPVLTLGPKGNRFILMLDIDYPMIGLIYILRWQPVAKESHLEGQVSTVSASRQTELQSLCNILTERFNEGELRTLATDMGVDYDSLTDEGMVNKARELVYYLERQNQIFELVKTGRQQRPDISWPEQPE